MECNFVNLVLLSLATLITIILYLVKKRLNYFNEKNILHIKPTFPMGNLSGIGTKFYLANIAKNVYDNFKGKDVLAGMYYFTEPVFVILDRDLAKNIVSRDFNDFQDRGVYYNKKDDPNSAHLFAIDGAKWKLIRNKLTPMFTPGKLKLMFESMCKCSETLENHLKPIAERGEDIEIKDMFARFTTDVIGSIAFGVEFNSINNPNTDIRHHSNRFIAQSYWIKIIILLGTQFPNLCRKLKLKVIEANAAKFFSSTFTEVINYRRNNDFDRKDFIAHLLQSLNESNIETENELSLEEIIAQCVILFVGGFQAPSSTMAFCLYELSKNEQKQEKLRNEIHDCLREEGGELTYEGLKRMKYLSATIDETLRMYPIVDNLTRLTTNDYKVENTNYIIPKGKLVFIPSYAYHHDPNIFPNPNEFQPERFLCDDKDSLSEHPFSYLPFGKGQRECIGKSYALMLTKIALVYVLRSFKVITCNRTPKVVEFTPQIQFLELRGGTWMQLEKCENQITELNYVF